VRGSTKTRGGSRWGEDLQERFDFEGSGDVKAELTLWNGKAASAIELAVIPSPIPTVVLVALAVVLTCVGLWIEVRNKVDRFGRDLGILTFYAVFLRHGTTTRRRVPEACSRRSCRPSSSGRGFPAASPGSSCASRRASGPKDKAVESG
jgi:hypothetical protein